MTILFTVTNDLTYDQRMCRICQTLYTEGYDICLIGREMPDSKPFDTYPFRHKRFRLFFNQGKLFYLEYNLRLFFWLLFQRFDAVCGIDLDTILPCYFASKLNLQNRACIYDAHELFSETPEVIRRPKIRRFWLAVEKFIIPRVKYRYTVSQSVADEFERRYGYQFELIRNLPIRLDSPKSLQSESLSSTNLFRILYQGNLNEGRGLETAVLAMREMENAVLWIVGDGVMMPILRGMVSRHDLAEKVRFWGFVAPVDLPTITRQASVGLHISEDKGLSYQLSLGNKFLDYIQAGIPQVFTKFIEYERLNETFEIGLMIEKTDTSLLVAALKQLQADKDLYSHLRLNCQKAAEVLCWEHESKKLVAFYKDAFADIRPVIL
jgi:glycosyltransferase involved in cell wall biosynthesis